MSVLIVTLIAGLAIWRARTTESGFTPAAALPSTVDDPPTTGTDPQATEPQAAPAPAPVATVSMQAVVTAADRAAASGMNLGVAVLDLSTGELGADKNAKQQYYSASLAKLLVVVDMLDRRRAGQLTIPRSDLDLVDRALRSSDDGAMDALWGKYGGPAAITRVARRLGLTGTRAPSDVTQWGETLVTAIDLVKLYQHILRDMAPEDRAVIVGALSSATPTAADGFNQLFGLIAPGASAEHYAKQGWMSYLPAKRYLHSAGVVHDDRTGKDYAIALLSIQPSVSYDTARNRLSAVAAAATGTLGLT